MILGATATGKTRVALEVAARLGAEIVSFDASTVYRGLDVGTAKPSAAERDRVPHHLVDTCDPREEFSAARFVELAGTAIADVHARGRRVLLVGGTGLYLRGLLRGLVDAPPPDAALRQRLHERERRRPGSLHALLCRLDPTTAARTPPANVVRTVRALEHRIATGRPLTADRARWERGDTRPAIEVGLRLPRVERTRAIAERVDAMLGNGLLDEVQRLLDAGVPPDARALRAIGYRQAMAHLAGDLPLEEVRTKMIVATRQYAKRQDTWFRREPDVTWLEAPSTDGELPGVVERATIALR